VGALLTAVVGSGALLGAAVAYLAAFLALRSMTTPQERDVTTPDEPRGLLVTIRAVRDVVRGQPVLTVLLPLAAALALGDIFVVTLPLLVDELNAGSSGYGRLTAIMGVGLTIGAVWHMLISTSSAPGIRGVVGGAFVWGLLTVITGLMPTMGLVGVAVLLTTIVGSISISRLAVYVQSLTPKTVRGRFIGFQMALIGICIPIYVTFLPWLNELGGRRAPHVVGGAISAVAAAATAVALLRPSERGIRRLFRGRGIVALEVGALRAGLPRLTGNLDRIVNGRGRYQRIIADSDIIVDSQAFAHMVAFSGRILDYAALDDTEIDMLRRHTFRIAMANGLGPRRAARQVGAGRAKRRVWLAASGTERLTDLIAVVDGKSIGVLARLDSAAETLPTAILHARRTVLHQLRARLDMLAADPQLRAGILDALTRHVHAGITEIDTLILSAGGREPERGRDH
jgi:hypothetical protein